jgi:hypothetical protein
MDKWGHPIAAQEQLFELCKRQEKIEVSEDLKTRSIVLKIVRECSTQFKMGKQTEFLAMAYYD